MDEETWRDISCAPLPIPHIALYADRDGDSQVLPVTATVVSKLVSADGSRTMRPAHRAGFLVDDGGVPRHAETLEVAFDRQPAAPDREGWGLMGILVGEEQPGIYFNSVEDSRASAARYAKHANALVWTPEPSIPQHHHMSAEDGS